MRNKFGIFSLICIASLAAGASIGKAFSLITKGAQNASFKISLTAPSVTDYYLVGDFTSWAKQNTYKFIDNTSSMIPETNKTAEYILNNITLSKDNELSICDSNDAWYHEYDHSAMWASTPVTKSGENYKVLMSSTSYSFTFKIYSDSTTKLCVSASKNQIYLIPNSNWKESSAKFAVYFFNDTENEWTWMSPVGSGDVYKVDMPSKYSKLVFGRFNSTIVTPTFDNKWNKSGDFSITNFDPNNCVTISDGWWDDFTPTSGTSWSTK